MRRFRNLDDVKEEIRARTNLVEFISRYVTLTARGKRYIGLCPFHDDKNTPSFAVSPDVIFEATGAKGVWGCWSCDAKGDLFGFVQRQHDASFIEALEITAEIIGYDLTPHYRELTPDEQLREDRYTATEAVADLLCETLLQEPKKAAFFARRGINVDILRQFKVGWCPSLDFLNAHVERDIIAFLEPKISQRSLLFGDRFVYPQFTPQGRVWGWFARQPDRRADGIPKYVGTSAEAPLFDGTARLYGFAPARKLLRAAQFPLLIVEGFHDTLAAQQAGFPAVAACGTNLTAQQIETLETYAVRKAVACFDPDEAGIGGMVKLAERAHDIKSVQFEFVTMPLEPEEFIAHNGAQAFGDCLQEREGPLDFLIGRYRHLDTSTAMKKRDFLEHVCPLLLPWPRQSLTRILGIQSVSEITKLPIEAISDYLDERTGSSLANLPGELIILAELALNPQSWVLLGDISPGDFSLKRYAQTFALMRDLYENGAEVNIELLVMGAHNAQAPQEVVETIQKLQGVHRTTPEVFARDIRDKAIRRRAEEFAGGMARQVRDLKTPINETVAKLIEEVTSSTLSRSQRRIYSSREAVALTTTEIERRAEIDTGIAGLDMGADWEWLTQMLNGQRGGRVNLIAASSGVGKSIVAINFVHKLSVDPAGPQAAGLIVSMEMGSEENIMRLAAIDADVPHSYIDHARFEAKEQIDNFYASMARIESARLTWMVNQRSLRDIALQARLLQARGELDYILLDYVQLLDLSPYNDRWSIIEKYNTASQEMHALAESLDVPIIPCAQLNRAAMGEDIPTGERMGSSYKIYQDAHSCLILSPRENGLIGSLDKNRGGGTGHVKLSFDHNPQTSTLRVREIEVLKRMHA